MGQVELMSMSIMKCQSAIEFDEDGAGIYRQKSIILLAVQIEASFVSPLPRSKRNHRHCGSFQMSLDFSMASNQTARSIVWQVFAVSESQFFF